MPDRASPALAPPVPRADPLAPTMVPPLPLVARVDVAPRRLEDTGFAARYEEGEFLGVGGMGEVLRCKDLRIGREVALKRVRGGRLAQADAHARFVREARVQGQLEHPAIVPVYDLGVTAEGLAYFTMRRVDGVTLAEVIARLSRRDPVALHLYSLRKVLTAFSSVCLAVEFAHAHGVVHRDLKPNNVMLGSFGEVYLLDWGIAKVVAEDGRATPGSRLPTAQAKVTPCTSDGAATDSPIGTAGYMSPEQVRGERLDGRADVYALGAILFELLALVPLHEGDAADLVMKATVAGVEARASVRAPSREIAPELEAICVKSVALDPEDRFATARELHDAIEGYLDGDRDLERRRAMARALAGEAEEHTRRALAASAPGGRTAGGEGNAREAREGAPDADAGAAEARSRALRAVGRALAFDPECAEAMRTLVTLLTSPPRTMPGEVSRELARQARKAGRTANHAAAIGALVILAMLPCVLWMGVRSWPMLLGALVAVSVSAVTGFLGTRERSSRAVPIVMASCAMLFVACVTGLTGPLLGAPSIALACCMVFSFHPELPARGPVALAIAGLGLGVPVVLEGLGVVPPSTLFEGGRLVVLPRMVAFEPTPTLVYLVLSGASMIAAVCVYLARVGDALERAQRAVVLQGWQLKQLLPSRAERAAGAKRS